MSVDPNFASLVSSELLVACYFLLLLSAILALFGPWHAKTSTIRWFSASLIVNCACRGVFFGVPDDAWGGEVTPQDLDRNDPAYWKQFIQFVFYIIGDYAAELEYIQILYLWHKAQCILTDTYPVWPPRLLKGSIVYLGIWAITLLVLYMFEPFTVVLAVSSVGKLAICACIFGAFMYYLATLRNIMKTAAMRPSCYTMCCHPLRNDALLNDMREYNTWRARQKLARITRVCLLYSICAVLRAAVLSVQLKEALSNFTTSLDPNFWWSLVMCNYFVTEIVAAGLVLWIVSKPSKARHRGSTVGYSTLEGADAEMAS